MIARIDAIFEGRGSHLLWVYLRAWHRRRSSSPTARSRERVWGDTARGGAANVGRRSGKGKRNRYFGRPWPGPNGHRRDGRCQGVERGLRHGDALVYIFFHGIYRHGASTSVLVMG